MANDLTGKKVFITGGSRGIGKAIALNMAEAGADICLSYNSSEKEALGIVDQIKAMGREASCVKLDGRQPEKAKEVVDQAVRNLGGLDVLVNNAGTGKEGVIGTPEANLKAFDDTFNVNVRTVYAITHEAIPHLKSGARVINISSILGERAMCSETGIYNASKFAVTGLTRSWAHDLGGKNITVNAIQPGPIDTDLNPANVGSGQEELTALKRYGQPEEIANLAVFLASDKSSYMTGACINVDGGANA